MRVRINHRSLEMYDERLIRGVGSQSRVKQKKKSKDAQALSCFSDPLHVCREGKPLRRRIHRRNSKLHVGQIFWSTSLKIEAEHVCPLLDPKSGFCGAS